MLGKIVLAAIGAGFAAGVVATGKLSGVRRRVENSIRPRKNKVAHIKVDLEDGVDPSDLRFVVVQPTRSKTREAPSEEYEYYDDDAEQ